jgi:HK97 family phage portal protein
MRVRDPISSLTGMFNRAPVPYTSRRGQGFRDLMDRVTNDAAAQMDAMAANGTLFSIVNRTSTAFARVKWHMHQFPSYKRSDAICSLCEEKGVKLYEGSHPAMDVWNEPNPFYTQMEFAESYQQHVDLTGEGWWVLNYGPLGIPDSMWIVRPDKMAPNRHPTEFLAGYTYLGPDGEKIPLRNDEVVQIRLPNPKDPWRGMGPVQAMLYNIDSMRYSAEWNRRFFLNDASPGGVIEIGDKDSALMDDDEFDEFQARWAESHRGVRNAHRVALIEKGGKWIDRSYSQRDMQFTELRRVGREEMWEAFGISKALLGIVEDVNRGNNDAQRAMFAELLTVPRLDRAKGALNKDFLPRFGKDQNKKFEFAYISPVPEDREANNAERTSKAEAYKTLTDAGVHPDDAAKVVGLPPMRHVDRPTAPLQPAA